MFWLPETHDGTIILTASPLSVADGVRFAPETWPGDSVVRQIPGGAFILLREGPVQHRLWLPGPPQPGALLAAVTPLDASASSRSQAALRFRRHLTGRRAAGPSAFPKQRLRRLALMLRALDGRNGGASYRAIAESLHGPRRVAAEAWKTASIRDTTIRLVRSGIAMMKDGYRKLLGVTHKD